MSKLTSAQIEQMWLAYTEKPNVHYVAEKCRVNRQTVRRYRDSEGWDARLAALKEKTAEKVDDQLSTVKARQLRIVRAAMASAFVTGPDGKQRLAFNVNSVSDLERLMKLELLLSGGPTGRVESTEGGVDLGHLTDDQLHAEIAQRLGILGAEALGALAAGAGRGDQEARPN